MTGPEEFRDRVRAQAHGSPYVVVDTATGFDVRIDVADARWYAPMYQQGLSTSFTHHVHLDPAARTYRVTDDAYQVDWQRGAGPADQPVPVLRRSAERTVGRVHEVSFGRVYAWDDRGDHGKQLDFSFSSAEGRALITAAARDTGWTEQAPGTARAALYVAGGVLALLALVALVVLLVLR